MRQAVVQGVVDVVVRRGDVAVREVDVAAVGLEAVLRARGQVLARVGNARGDLGHGRPLLLA